MNPFKPRLDCGWDEDEDPEVHGDLEKAIVRVLLELRETALAYAGNPVLTVKQRKEGFQILAVQLGNIVKAIEHQNDYAEGEYGWVL